MTQDMSEQDRAKHRAFAAALKGLYEMYPLPEYKYRKVQWQRENDRAAAVRNALSGSPLFMVDIFAHKVPRQEIENIHKLIYG